MDYLLRKKTIAVRVVLLGDLDQKGDPNSKKLGLKDLILQIFCAKGAENFEKFKGFKFKIGTFWNFRGKFGYI